MDICNMSAIDWEAVGALGTWAVGGAAIFVAIKANSISADLKRAEQERADRAARAVAAGMRIEILSYSQALQRLAERLEAVTKESWDEVDIPGHAAAAMDQMRRVELGDRANLAGALSSLPPELARKISLLYAMQRKAHAIFANNADYLREQKSFKNPNKREVIDHLNHSADEYRQTIVKIEEVTSALAAYINLSESEPQG